MIEKWGGGVAARSSLFSSLHSSCLRLLACRRRVGLLAGGRTTLHAASGGDTAGKNCNLPVDNHICRIEFLGAVPDGYLLYAVARRGVHGVAAALLRLGPMHNEPRMQR